MLETYNISKSFRRGSQTISAVQNVSLSLETGGITAIIGRSGSGKSTLLNILAGVLTPDAGSVVLDGVDLYRQTDEVLSRLRNQSIGVIPQGQTALQNLRVLDNVLLPSGLFPGIKEDELSAQAVLDCVGIGDLADARPAMLSGGELRRMAIARAMIRRPKVILADEPTSDLDGENTAAVVALLREYAAQGNAVLLVTHEPETLRETELKYRMESGILRTL